MQSSLSRNILSAAIAVIVLTACAGSGNGSVPNATSPLAAGQSRFGKDASSIVFSGEYTGKFHVNGQGKLKVKLFLSQSQNTLGGALINKEGSQGLAGAIAWVANGNSISGIGIGPQPTSAGYCTFSMSGKYKYRRLTGTYSATYGCSGQTGTFSLWHKCYFQGTGSEAIRPETGVKPC